MKTSDLTGAALDWAAMQGEATRMNEISDAGRALSFLAQALETAEVDVLELLGVVLEAQEHLRTAIDSRDAVQKALNLAAQFVARETK